MGWGAVPKTAHRNLVLAGVGRPSGRMGPGVAVPPPFRSGAHPTRGHARPRSDDRAVSPGAVPKERANFPNGRWCLLCPGTVDRRGAARAFQSGVRNELPDGLKLVAGDLLRGFVLGEDVGHESSPAARKPVAAGAPRSRRPVHVAVADLEVLMYSSAVAGRVGDVPQPVASAVIEAVGGVGRS